VNISTTLLAPTAVMTRVPLGNPVSCCELGFAAGLGVWLRPSGVLLSIVYRLVRGLFGLLAVLVRSDVSKDAELRAPRTQLEVAM